MLHVHAQLRSARQAYRDMTYSGSRPIALEQASPTWWPGTAWQLAPVGLALACVLGLMVWWQGPESPGSQIPRASYRIMSIPVEMRPSVAVKVLPTLRKRARLQLATPLFKKPQGMAFRYPKRPVRDRGVGRRDHSTQHHQSYRARLS